MSMDPHCCHSPEVAYHCAACHGNTCGPEAGIKANVRKAAVALVMAQSALETALTLSEWADYDYALEHLIGEVKGLGVMLTENPDNLPSLAWSLGFTG